MYSILTNVKGNQKFVNLSKSWKNEQNKQSLELTEQFWTKQTLEQRAVWRIVLYTELIFTKNILRKHSSCTS